MPVLIDTGDVLYGKLGVALCPVLGIADQDHKLVAYQYFTEINFVETVLARIRFQLKEIGQPQLDAVLSPPAAADEADSEAAHRRLKLGEKLYQAKNYAKALENVNKSIEKDPALAAAYVLKGRILVTMDKKDEARKAFGEALKLEPANAGASEGLKACDK
jgi:tetratricopeptide (TPR) repeat protein